MTPAPTPAPAAPTASPALSAFLRGIERRAFVFAQLQCGNDQVAQAALGRAMRAFRSTSAVSPLSAWPAAFWALLLAQAELSRGESAAPELDALGSGPRAALLLRMVGGLDFPHAAQVLGVSEATYRFALQRALQQLGDAGISYAALGELRERLHHRVKTLPQGRIDALADLRAQVLEGAPERAPVAPRAVPAWRRRLPWVLLALLGLAFAATFWPAVNPLQPGGTEGLPVDATPPPPPEPTDADRITHPDYALLAAPEDDALAADLAFLSWMVAGQGAAVPATVPAATAPAAVPGEADLAAPPPLLAPLAAAWPGLDPATRRRLQQNASHWQRQPPPQRAALAQRMREWDALPAAERARRRGAFAAWQALPLAEREQVRVADARLRALPAEQAQALRAAFDALPADQRQDWWLGPVIGSGFTQLRPLFAFVPEDERLALLEILRGLGPQPRADLAMLALRLPANERESLRRELMAAPAAERDALIRERLQR